jgi:four helix bundle protein
MDEAELKQRTKRFALRVIKLVESLPKSTAADVPGRQVARSGAYVGANYRSACRGRSKAEFASKIGICAEEADETVYWLELIQEAALVRPKLLEELLREANELAAIFIASSRTAQGRAPAR